MADVDPRAELEALRNICNECGEPIGGSVELLTDERGTVYGQSRGCACPPDNLLNETADDIRAELATLADTGQTVACPICMGTGRVDGIACTRHETTGARIGCSTCKRSGRVDRNYPARTRLGDRLRRQRVNAGRSLRQEAERLGVSPRTLSDWENGRVPND